MSAGNGSLGGLSTDELRAAVRAVLREVLPGVAGHGAAAAPVAVGAAALRNNAAPTPQPIAQPEQVTLRTDVDLDAFVRRVASLCEDPASRAAMQNGHRRFRLSGPTSAAPRSLSHASPGVHRIERGAVTERAVKKAAADGGRLVVGRRAVLTPLARDRASVLGVVIERER
jgi:hypothetical protein